jgi:hypothetical protein
MNSHFDPVAPRKLMFQIFAISKNESFPQLLHYIGSGVSNIESPRINYSIFMKG